MSLIRKSVVTSAIGVMGSLISFGNQVLLAWMFGASAQMNLYTVAISGSLLVTGLIVGALGYLLVPVFAGVANDDRAHARLSTALVLLVVAAGLLATVPGWLWIYGQHAGAAVEIGIAKRVFARITLAAWLWLPLGAASAVCAAALNTKQRFYVAALVQPLPMMGALAACISFGRSVGIEAVAWGQACGYAGMLATLLWAARAEHPRREDFSQAARVLGRLPLSLFGLALFVIYPASDAYWGSRLGGSAVSYLAFGQRIIVGLTGVVVVGASAVIFPRLALHASDGRNDQLRADVSTGVRLMMICTAPMAVALAVFASPLARLLFQRGAFTAADTRELAALLPLLALGIVPMSCMNVTFRALYAMRSLKLAAALSTGGALLYCIASGVFSTGNGLAGIGWAYAVTWWCAFAASFLAIWGADTWRQTVAWSGFFARLLACLAAFGAGSWMAAHWWGGQGTEHAALGVLPMLSSVLTGAVLFAALGHYVLPEMRILSASIIRLPKGRSLRNAAPGVVR